MYSFLAVIALLLLLCWIVLLVFFPIYRFIKGIKPVFKNNENLANKNDTITKKDYKSKNVKKLSKKNKGSIIKHIYSISKSLKNRILKLIKKCLAFLKKMLRNLFDKIVLRVKDFIELPLKRKSGSIIRAILVFTAVLSVLSQAIGTKGFNILLYIQNHFPNIYNIYTIVLLISCLYMISRPIYLVKHEKKGFSKSYNIVTSIVINIAILYNTYNILHGYMIKGSLSFTLVIIFISLILIFSVYTIKTLIDNTKINWFTILSGIVSVLLISLFILVLLGLYNITVDDKINVIKNLSGIEFISRATYYGSQYTFEYPQIQLGETLIPFIQYILWKLYSLIIIGYFITYFMDIIRLREKKSFEDQKTDIEKMDIEDRYISKYKEGKHEE